MNKDLEDKYINLLKNTLSFNLWPETPIPLRLIGDYSPAPIGRLIKILDRILYSFRITIVYLRKKDVSDIDRLEGRPYYSMNAETMIGLKRLDNLQFCVESVLKDGIKGDFIETGVWRGGACIFMRGILAAHGIKDRRVFVADSFEGLPKPDENNFPADKGSKYYKNPLLSVSQEVVENNFSRFNLLDDQVIFIKGWFKDTLPGAPIETLSILRLDGDMYGSTYEALTYLYPKLQSGGYCIIDDYGALDTCKQAVDDYRSTHDIEDELREIDWTGRYWRKT